MKKAILRVGLGLRFDEVTSISSLIASLLIETLSIEMHEVDNRSLPVHVMMRWKVPRSRASRLGNQTNTFRIRPGVAIYLRSCRHQLPKLDVAKRSDLAEDEQKMVIISTTSMETPFYLVMKLVRRSKGTFCCVSGFTKFSVTLVKQARKFQVATTMQTQLLQRPETQQNTHFDPLNTFLGSKMGVSLLVVEIVVSAGWSRFT